MRTERAIVLQSTDTVGPTRLQLLTASSTKLPVVVVEQAGGGSIYHVFDVAAVQAALTNVLSATRLPGALDLDERSARQPVSSTQAPLADPGTPVVENGRLLGVTAVDKPETPEPSEADMARGGPDSADDGGGKRGLWRRRSKSEN